jgi:hypothetical protein
MVGLWRQSQEHKKDGLLNDMVFLALNSDRDDEYATKNMTAVIIRQHLHKDLKCPPPRTSIKQSFTAKSLRQGSILGELTLHSDITVFQACARTGHI